MQKFLWTWPGWARLGFTVGLFALLRGSGYAATIVWTNTGGVEDRAELEPELRSRRDRYRPHRGAGQWSPGHRAAARLADGKQGQAATFSVAATGNYLGYRWQFGNNWLAGATNATLVLNNVTPANAGDYKVEVSNLAGIVLSAEVTLTVIVPPTITEQPVSQNVRAGSSFSLSVRLSGPAPFIYQWLKGGQPVSGATSEPAVVAVMARPLSRLERRPARRGTLNPECSPRRWMARR